jgi:hypothetical protein
MSTLTVQTISNGTVSTSSENVIRGSARAWVNFNGTSAAIGLNMTIRSSYNVSSVVRNGTGTYTINFTNAFANADYCCTATTGAANSASVNLAIGFVNAGYLAGSVQLLAEQSAGVDTASPIMCVVAHG